MSYRTIGTPISVVRYKIDRELNKVTNLEYYTAKRDIKITTQIDEINKKSLVTVDSYKDGSMKSYPIGPQTTHPLIFYKNIAKYNEKRIPTLKIKKNTTDHPISIDIPFGDYDMQIPLYPNHNAVYYLDYISIYRRDKNKEVSRFYVLNDGIYEVAHNEISFTYINKTDGNSNGSIIMANIKNHDEFAPVLNMVQPISIYPSELKDEAGRLYMIDYDIYGLMKSISVKNGNCDLKCYYENMCIGKKHITQSIHHLIYDNFDIENYFIGTRKVVEESITVDEESDNLEYIRVIYDNVENIIEEPNYIIDFDSIVSILNY